MEFAKELHMVVMLSEVVDIDRVAGEVAMGITGGAGSCSKWMRH